MARQQLTILHIDLDACYTSVEQRDRSVIVGGSVRAPSRGGRAESESHA
jgi:hypothetical protein